MLISADELRKYLNLKLSQVNSKRIAMHYTDQMVSKFDYPINISSDFLTFRRSLEEANDYDLFVLLFVIDESKLKDYFTQKEIEYYTSSKYKKAKLDKNLKFNVIEISEDQWIGKITAKELISYKEAQIINYNENTQRTMKHMVMGNNEYYQIYLNSVAVKSITDLLESNLYIPSTITLNIPEDVDLHYDKKTNTLSLKDVEYLDIIDGYHRYIAISKCIYHNDNFDYPMELRLVRYDENKANQFIYQEDQKTRMRKIDSDSRNQYNEANQIVKKLNESSNMAGLITQNGGIIDASVMAKLIDIIFFSCQLSKADKRILKIDLQKKLLKLLDEVTEIDVRLLSEKWSRNMIFSFLLCCNKYDDARIIVNKMRDFDYHSNINIYTLSKKQIKEFTDMI